MRISWVSHGSYMVFAALCLFVQNAKANLSAYAPPEPQPDVVIRGNTYKRTMYFYTDTPTASPNYNILPLTSFWRDGIACKAMVYLLPSRGMNGMQYLSFNNPSAPMFTDSLAQILAEDGYKVWLFSPRSTPFGRTADRKLGNCDTPGKCDVMQDWGMDKYASDVNALSEIIRNLESTNNTPCKDKKLILGGVSLGTTVAVHAVNMALGSNKQLYDGLILSENIGVIDMTIPEIKGLNDEYVKQCKRYSCAYDHGQSYDSIADACDSSKPIPRYYEELGKYEVPGNAASRYNSADFFMIDECNTLNTNCDKLVSRYSSPEMRFANKTTSTTFAYSTLNAMQLFMDAEFGMNHYNPVRVMKDYYCTLKDGKTDFVKNVAGFNKPILYVMEKASVGELLESTIEKFTGTTDKTSTLHDNYMHFDGLWSFGQLPNKAYSRTTNDIKEWMNHSARPWHTTP